MFYGPCGLFYNAGLFEEKGWSLPTTYLNLRLDQAIGIAFPLVYYVHLVRLRIAEHIETVGQLKKYKNKLIDKKQSSPYFRQEFIEKDYTQTPASLPPASP